MPSAPIRLFCFDAGFTLIRPRRTMQQHLADALERHGHAAGEEEVHAAWQAADRWFWEGYHEPGNRTWTSDEEIERTWRAYHRIMLEQLGFEAEEVDVVSAILESQFSPDGWEPYPETIEALQLVHQSADPRPAVAVVSDWESTLVNVLEGTGIGRWVDQVLASGGVGHAKPEREIFLLACEGAGVTPAEAVMIGDSLRADVLGARSVGMRGILLDRDGVALERGGADGGPDPASVPDLERAPDLVSAVALALAPA